ncbi:MAG: molybdopterin oxidoreductase [Deltaproteobacteria bacterium]|nr:molybdopterin oxidoreductase [Deltaproteobacteria bacterium]
MHFFYLGLTALGAAAFFVGLGQDAGRAWHNYLLNYFFWFSLSISGLFFIALSYVTTSQWASPLKRVPEALTGFLPVAFVLLLILFAGSHHLYEWTHHEAVAGDPLLSGKRGYLNMPFFVIRNLLFFVLWIGVAFYLIRNSLRQDRTGAVELTFKNKKVSAPFLVLFGITFTLASFDLLMSLEPHWFSTIFGVYCFAGLFESGMAITILFVLALRRQGALRGVINENHLHDLGKLMFAFCVFWAYIAFSQYMLIWYGNLPEETPYMIRRTEGSWTPVALALLFGKFIVPFFLLLSRWAKRNEFFLALVAVWVLVFQYLDIYWIVFPTVGAPAFGWMELGILLGFLGLFVLSVTAVLQRIPPVARRDPWLEEGLSYHQ